MTTAFSFFADQDQVTSPLTKRNLDESVSNLIKQGKSPSAYQDQSLIGDKFFFALVERGTNVKFAKLRKSEVENASIDALLGGEVEFSHMCEGGIPYFRATAVEQAIAA